MLGQDVWTRVRNAGSGADLISSVRLLCGGFFRCVQKEARGTMELLNALPVDVVTKLLVESA